MKQKKLITWMIIIVIGLLILGFAFVKVVNQKAIFKGDDKLNVLMEDLIDSNIDNEFVLSNEVVIPNLG